MMKALLVGRAAQKRLTKDPKNTFYSVKRFMGKRVTDRLVVGDARRVPFEVVGSDPITATATTPDSSAPAPASAPANASATATTATTATATATPLISLAGLGPKGDGGGLAALNCPSLGRKVMPEEASMHILRRLLDMAEREIGQARP